MWIRIRMELRVSQSRSKWRRMLIKSQIGSILAKVTALARLPRGWAATDCWPVASVCGGRAESGERPRRLVREERAASLRPAAAPPIDFSVNCVGTRKTHKCCISSQTFAPPALDDGLLCVADLFIFVYTWILVCNLIPRKLSQGMVQHPGKVVQAFICHCIWLLGSFF